MWLKNFNCVKMRKKLKLKRIERIDYNSLELIKMSTEINEKEIILRMAQSLRNEIKSQMASNKEGITDARPYARRYIFLKERIEALKIDGNEIFLPNLSENLVDKGHSSKIFPNVEFVNEISVAISQMVSFLEVVQKDSIKILTNLEEFLFKNLRKSIRNKPLNEKEVQEIIQIMLNSKDYIFKREKVRINYSSKEFIPDFTFEDLDAVLEVKLCKTDKKEKDIIDEINADIPAYLSRYRNVTFLVYDLGIIRDSDLFVRDIEKNNPRIKVLIIKH